MNDARRVNGHEHENFHYQKKLNFLEILYQTSRGARLRPVHFQHPLQILSPIHPPFSGLPFNFGFMKFSQKCTVRTSRTTLWPPPTQGVGVPEKNISYNLPGVDVVLHAKFEHCGSNGVAAYREQTHRHTHTQSPLLHRCFQGKKNLKK